MNKKSTSYLSKVYSKQNKPFTSYPEKLARMLLEQYMPRGRSNLLDIGCGRGELSLHFSKYHNVHAIDNSDFKHPTNYKYTHMDLVRGIDLPDNSFDIIFSKSVIEHFRNPLDLLEEMKRVLKPNGTFICMTPDWESQYRNFYNDCTHLTFFEEISQRRSKYLRTKRNQSETPLSATFTWNNKITRIIPKIINIITPYEIYDKAKLTRFSREKMLIAQAKNRRFAISKLRCINFCHIKNHIIEKVFT